METGTNTYKNSNEYCVDKNTSDLQDNHDEPGLLYDEVLREAEKSSMNPDRIWSHRKRLGHVLHNLHKEKNVFDILDTCRIENGRIFAFKDLVNLLPVTKVTNGTKAFPDGYAAFVPSAGAASRYLADLECLRRSFESGDFKEIKTAWKNVSFYRDVIPSDLSYLMDRITNRHDVPEDLLKQFFKSPKAVLPCGYSGRTFLFQKICEHDFFGGLSAQFYIIPPGMHDLFRRHNKDQNRSDIYFYEQTRSCSTFRFNQDGSLARDFHGKPSIVPAGHGSLLSLFPEIKMKHPNIRALFIRNIDNICATSPETRIFTNNFILLHNHILTLLDKIRSGLSEQNNNFLQASPDEEKWFLQIPNLKQLSQSEIVFLKKQTHQRERILWEILIRVFLTPLWCCKSGEKSDLLRLFQRPMNLMGQVKNRGNEKGGSPVVIKTSRGDVTICLERPHAKIADQKEILDKPEKATHFNPVFLIAELSEYKNFQDHQTPFWIAAQKTWMGKPVMYYETALYELLGNTATTNCIFTEAPDFIFNPRKSLQDAFKEIKSPHSD